MAEDVTAQASDASPNAASLAKALAPLVATVGIALFSLVSLCRVDSRAATAAEWKAAAEAVRGERTSGELIVFAPDWLDPLGRRHLGDQMDVDMAARMDSARFAGVWEVSVGGARASETAGLKSDRSFSHGPLTVRHYPQTPAALVYDFTAQWRAAKTTGDVQGRPKLSLEEVGFEPHRCVKVVPRPGGTAVMTFTNVPLGTRIVGYVGLADIFTRRDVREPGRLSLLVDGKLAAEVRAGINDGWRRFEAETTPGTGDVAFHLTAVGAGARDRRICFAAEARQ